MMFILNKLNNGLNIDFVIEGNSVVVRMIVINLNHYFPFVNFICLT